MRRLLHQLGNLSAALVAVFLASAAGGVELINVSPFISPGAPAAAAPSTGTIEFRGLSVMPDGTHFVIYDTATKKPSFVMLGDTSNPYVVRSYKAGPDGADQVTVEYQGRTMVLSARKSTVRNLGPANIGSAGAAAAAANAAAKASTPILPPNASIEEWAAELQKRRDDRATTLDGAPAVPAPPAPPAAPAAPLPRG